MKAEIYVDGKGEHRFRLLSGNSRIVAESGEGYSDEAGVRKALLRLAAWIARSPASAALKLSKPVVGRADRKNSPKPGGAIARRAPKA